MTHRQSRSLFEWIPAATLLIVILPCIYIGSYYALVDPPESDPFGPPYNPAYRIRWEPLRTFFRPAHEVDRVIRSSRWNGESY